MTNKQFNGGTAMVTAELLCNGKIGKFPILIFRLSNGNMIKAVVYPDGLFLYEDWFTPDEYKAIAAIESRLVGYVDTLTCSRMLVTVKPDGTLWSDPIK